MTMVRAHLRNAPGHAVPGCDSLQLELLPAMAESAAALGPSEDPAPDQTGCGATFHQITAQQTGRR